MGSSVSLKNCKYFFPPVLSCHILAIFTFAMVCAHNEWLTWHSDGMIAEWHHQDCFLKRYQIKSGEAAAIRGMDEIRWEDKEKLMDIFEPNRGATTTASSSSQGSPGTTPTKNRKRKFVEEKDERERENEEEEEEEYEDGEKERPLKQQKGKEKEEEEEEEEEADVNESQEQPSEEQDIGDDEVFLYLFIIECV